MPKTEAQKKAQKKYVEKNKEAYLSTQRESALKYYYAHKEEILEKKKAYYQKKKEVPKVPEII
jgi:hypothetical protein